ncbi:type IV pilin-like G/H family protein [Nostocaceae cyanobacterium CENA369]|uniref:Type IV pilin-like G/H family protein n=1 Tax=Dendronalium phyllosphericum CENA369 TaxID=1725256 RepID=A0A8J7I8P2_9NOST|nr:type IV pilin-like G/H family protein [Dendronalium phyllosphericum]MBH8574527.1 type IV pilin-like G/H family protein [Dendronalium phyllosphericum CENA369]
MSKILPIPDKLSIASKMLTSSVFVALLVTLNATVLAQPSTAPIPTQSQPNQQKNSVAQKLLGQWQAKDPSSSNSLNFIFAPEGKLFIYFLDSKNPTGIELKYRINPIPKPMHIDITIPSNQKPVLTIFELTADGQLQLQIEGTNPGKPRPTAFSSQVSLFRKISDATTLPANIKLTDLNDNEIKSNNPQSEGQLFIGAINRAQQAYYLENEKFSSTLEQLQLGIKPETENYRYRILTQGNQNQSVISTAAAKKPELRSYTGIAFIRKVKNDVSTFTAICETDKPSTIPPVAPKLPIKESQAVQCPRGSHLLSQ